MAGDAPPPTRKGFGPYARCLADKMELRDWTVGVSEEPPEQPHHIGEARCRYGQKFVTIALSDRFLRAPEDEQRLTVCHELIHAHLAPVDLLLKQALGEGAWAAYQLSMEYAVEALAQALAPSLPLPSEVSPVKPRRKAKAMSVKKVGKGYENVSKGGQKFSKKPLSKADAEAQLRAIEASKAKAKKGK